MSVEGLPPATVIGAWHERMRRRSPSITGPSTLSNPSLYSPQRNAGMGIMSRAALSFFAVDPSLATGGGAQDAAAEMRQLVSGLHSEGIEVRARPPVGCPKLTHHTRRSDAVRCMRCSWLPALGGHTGVRSSFVVWSSSSSWCLSQAHSQADAHVTPPLDRTQCCAWLQRMLGKQRSALEPHTVLPSTLLPPHTQVWLQMEFCLTAEGGDGAAHPVSLRGIDGKAPTT